MATRASSTTTAAIDDEGASASSRNPRVDDYIARAAPFARPILAHLRHVVHAACPDVEEEIKWGMPFFVRRGNVCHMAAFKAHCAFGFWRGKDLGLPQTVGEDAMGTFGRIGSLDDLPPKRQLTACIKAAVKLNEAGKPTRPARAAKAAVVVPDDVAAALAANAEAARHFAAFAPGAQRDYVEWIVEAKRPETRTSRIATLVEQSGEGKTRHWKYQR